MDDNLYLIEALIQSVKFNGSEIDKKDIRVDITLGKIANFTVKFEKPDVGGHIDTKLQPNPGKSYLFPASGYVLQHQMNDSEISLAVNKLSIERCIGKTVMQWPRAFVNLVKESRFRKDLLPASCTKILTFIESEGSIEIFLRLSCFGQNIQTQYQVVQTKNASMSYLFKGTDVPTSFRTPRYGQGGSDDLLAVGPLYSHKNRGSPKNMSNDSLELTPSQIEEELCGNEDCIAAYKFKKFGIGPLAKPKPIPMKAPCGGEKCPHKYEVDSAPCTGLKRCSFMMRSHDLGPPIDPISESCTCGPPRAAGGSSRVNRNLRAGGQSSKGCSRALARPAAQTYDNETQSPFRMPCGKKNCKNLNGECEQPPCERGCGKPNCKYARKEVVCTKPTCKKHKIETEVICEECGGYSRSGKTCKDLPIDLDQFPMPKESVPPPMNTDCFCNECVLLREKYEEQFGEQCSVSGCYGDQPSRPVITELDDDGKPIIDKQDSVAMWCSDRSRAGMGMGPTMRLKSGGISPLSGKELVPMGGDFEKKIRSNLVYDIGDTYPGCVVGHKDCYLRGRNVPWKMGWLWSPEMTIGKLKGRRNFKPGYIEPNVLEIINSHRQAAGLTVPEKKEAPKKKKRGKGGRTVIADADADDEPEYIVDEKQTLQVNKKDGNYTIMMNPLRDPLTVNENEDPYLNCMPMVFKLCKPAKPEPESISSESCDCCRCGEDLELAPSEKSSDSTLDIEFTPPTGVIDMDKMHKYPNVCHFWTQYDLADIGLAPPPSAKGKNKKGKGKGKKK